MSYPLIVLSTPQGITVLVGIVSYAVVHFRRRRIELLVARRIQQQINA